MVTRWVANGRHLSIFSEQENYFVFLVSRNILSFRYNRIKKSAEVIGLCQRKETWAKNSQILGSGRRVPGLLTCGIPPFSSFKKLKVMASGNQKSVIC